MARLFDLKTGALVRNVVVNAGDLLTGVWSDGDTLWVLNNPQHEDNDDHGGARIFAFDLTTGGNPGQDYSHTIRLATENSHPMGLTVVDGVMWVGDIADAKVYVYTWSNKRRLPDRDIPLTTSAGNLLGMWTDGETLWAIDHEDRTLYAYDVDTKSRVESLDLSLPRSLAGKALAGFCITGSRRIQDLYGMVVHVIRCNTHFTIDNRR